MTIKPQLSREGMYEFKAKDRDYQVSLSQCCCRIALFVVVDVVGIVVAAIAIDLLLLLVRACVLELLLSLFYLRLQFLCASNCTATNHQLHSN